MKHAFLLLLCISIQNFYIFAQQDAGSISGKVLNTQQQTLAGATVYWLHGTQAVITDAQGAFLIPREGTLHMLVASYIGHNADTITIDFNQTKKPIVFRLSQGVDLEKVQVTHKVNTTFSSSLEPMKIQVMSEHELNKAACCNLSESFETNPSIDVSFTDAVTGTRQIQMLGLTGPNIQITRENMPDIRGLSAIYGLTFVPGAWIESIHVNKGAGSVVNGFESIAGQIDVQMRNPFTMDKLFVNAYANESGRYELNVNTKKKVSDHLATGLLLHGKTNSMLHDANHDGFMDMPIGDQLIALNRWELETNKGWHIQLGAKATYFDIVAGQMDFEKSMPQSSAYPWGMTTHITRIDGWSKIGKVFENKPGYSFGFQTAASQHNQSSTYGLNVYDAEQTSGYANFILQGYVFNTNHVFKTGASMQYDSYRELLNSTIYNRTEIVPGTFGEYSYSYLTKFNAVAGLRADYHNLFGAFVTPRMHLRYAPTTKLTLRASGGRGQRTANIFAENSNLLASSREIIIVSNNTTAYGLNPEVAWNYGANATRTFKLWYRNGSVSVDAYRTHFTNQIVVDFVQDPQKAIFYNLNGQSFSNSLQAQVDYEIVKRIDMRIAYRWYDVQTSYNEVVTKKPLIAQHRAFINLGYTSRKMFQIDYTLNWQGAKPLPNLSTNPEAYRLPKKSPHFIVMNAQISKSWHERFDIYLGAENILGYTQKNPIIASQEPYSQYFDSSIIWGPVFGREIYAGLRYRL